MSLVTSVLTVCVCLFIGSGVGLIIRHMCERF